MTLKIGIVEDSKENIDTLRFLLNECDVDVEVVGEAKTLDDARSLLNADMDVALLDIQLREGTIFEILEEMHSKQQPIPRIIFTTAHGSFEYATKAIRFAALDFLTKPLSRDDLNMALGRVVDQPDESIDSRPGDAQIGFLLNLLRGNMQSPSSIGIILPKSVIEFVELSDIIYFRADEGTCKVILNNSLQLHSTRHLGYYIELLIENPEFVQVSKGCLINTSHIKRYNHREKSISLKNGETLVASHRFSKVLKKSLLENQDRALSDTSFIRKLFGK